eukprot:8348861-Ditylum_brightwellii.AAC.1
MSQTEADAQKEFKPPVPIQDPAYTLIVASGAKLHIIRFCVSNYQGKYSKCAMVPCYSHETPTSIALYGLFNMALGLWSVPAFAEKKFSKMFA